MMLQPSQIIAQLTDNLKMYISSSTGTVTCESWSTPIDGEKIEVGIEMIPMDFISDVDTLIRELFNMTIERIMQDAGEGRINE